MVQLAKSWSPRRFLALLSLSLLPAALIVMDGLGRSTANAADPPCYYLRIEKCSIFGDTPKCGDTACTVEGITAKCPAGTTGWKRLSWGSAYICTGGQNGYDDCNPSTDPDDTLWCVETYTCGGCGTPTPEMPWGPCLYDEGGLGRLGLVTGIVSGAGCGF